MMFIKPILVLSLGVLALAAPAQPGGGILDDILGGVLSGGPLSGSPLSGSPLSGSPLNGSPLNGGGPLNNIL